MSHSNATQSPAETEKAAHFPTHRDASSTPTPKSDEDITRKPRTNSFYKHKHQNTFKIPCVRISNILKGPTQPSGI